jgi:hypothetical protein
MSAVMQSPFQFWFSAFWHQRLKRDVRKFQAAEMNYLSIIRIIKWMGRDKIKDKDIENVWK